MVEIDLDQLMTEACDDAITVMAEKLMLRGSLRLNDPFILTFDITNKVKRRLKHTHLTDYDFREQLRDRFRGKGRGWFFNSLEHFLEKEGHRVFYESTGNKLEIVLLDMSFKRLDLKSLLRML